MADANRVKQIFAEAVQLPADDRAAFNASAAAGDDDVRAEVESLLAAMDGAGNEGFLTSPTHQQSVDTIKSSSTETAGAQIDRYKLLQLIGEGGFGSVWMAEQKDPVKRRVALKIIKLGMDTKQVIARFEAERQALAMMDHPNIAKVLDAGSTDTGRPYFVMEYIRGIPIIEYCDTEKSDTRIRLDLFMDVCHAIQHAHQKGIIHRDIKPTNVLVTLHDGKPVVKVIDFGIAKATNQELTDKTLFTQHRQMVGTPAYMSPVQAEMSGLDIDTRSDVYSLGVLLYELLTGTTPFANDELMSKGYAEMMRIIREVAPHKPSTRLSTLGETGSRTALQRHVADPKKLGLILRGDLDWIVMKALEKDRTRRYETANGFAMDVERYLHDEPVSAGPPSASYKLKKLIKRNKGAFAAAAAMFLVLTLGAVGTSYGMLWALNERERVTNQANRASDALRQVTDEFAASITTETTGETVVPIVASTQGGEVEALAITAVNLVRSLDAARTESQRELSRANEVKRLIAEMLQSVNPAVAQTTDTTLLRRILATASERLEAGDVRDELVAADLHRVIGNVYTSLSQFDASEAHLQRALAIHRRLLGSQHEETRRSAWGLGLLYLDSNRFREAEELFAPMVEDARRANGEENRDVLLMMTNLAYAYHGQSRFVEAEALYLRSLELKRRVLGEEDPDTLRCMNNLATLYWNLSRFDEAEPLMKQTLEVRERTLGPVHPETLTATANLANLYRMQSKRDEAEQLYIKAIPTMRRVLGDSHAKTTLFLHNLVALYADQQRFDDAEQLMHEVIENFRNTLGPENEQTLGAITDLGRLYNRMKRYDDARLQFESCLPVMRQRIGEQHQFTRYALDGLSRAHAGLGNLADAYRFHGELDRVELELAEKPGTPPNELNTQAWHLLTCGYLVSRDPARALSLAERACALEEAGAGANLWVYLDTLALAQHMTGDTATAIETQKRAIELMPEGADASVAERLAEYEAALSKPFVED